MVEPLTTIGGQCPLLHLASRRLLDLGDNLDHAGDLKSGHVGACPRPQLPFRDTGAPSQLHRDLDVFFRAGAQLGGDAKGRRVGDAGMFEEFLLDLRGVDVLPSSADDVLDAAHEVDVAVLVDASQVSRVEPEVRERGDGAGLVAEIALEKRVGLVAPQQHLARRVRRQRLVELVGDAELIPWTHPSTGARGKRALLHDGQARLDAAVQRIQGVSEALLVVLAEMRDGHPPRQAHVVVSVLARRLLLVGQRERRAHEVVDGGFRGADLVPEPARAEASRQCRRRAQKQCRDRGQRRGVGVEQRERTV